MNICLGARGWNTVYYVSKPLKVIGMGKYPYLFTFCDLTTYMYTSMKGVYTHSWAHPLIVNHVRPTESHSFLTADVKKQWSSRDWARAEWEGEMSSWHCIVGDLWGDVSWERVLRVGMGVDLRPSGSSSVWQDHSDHSVWRLTSVYLF